MRAGAAERGGTAPGSGGHAGGIVETDPRGPGDQPGARERRAHTDEWARVGPPGLRGAWVRLRVCAAREGTLSE